MIPKNSPEEYSLWKLSVIEDQNSSSFESIKKGPWSVKLRCDYSNASGCDSEDAGDDSDSKWWNQIKRRSPFDLDCQAEAVCNDKKDGENKQSSTFLELMRLFENSSLFTLILLPCP